MRFRIIYFIFLILYNYLSYGQVGSVSGFVRSDGEPLEFASISIKNFNYGTLTQVNGFFKIQNIPQGSYRLKVSILGYDTFSKPIQIISGQNTSINFQLKPNIQGIQTVVISGTQREVIIMDSPIPVEVLTSSFLKKNPSTNIFEALGAVNGVQPQLNCNVCNTGDIHINGMEGPYTMVLIDGMPIVSALSTVYGLAGIPSGLVQRIEIVKGPASTLYGSEAMGGVINVITKDATNAPRFYSDISGTAFSEFNADLAGTYKLRKSRALFGLNGFYHDKIFDINKDGFTDFALQKRLSVFNKLEWNGKSGKQNSMAFRLFTENRWGGQLNYSKEFRGTDSVYGEQISTNRVELIGKQYLTKHKNPLLFEYSYNYHQQNSYYGLVSFNAYQHTLFGQVRWNYQTKKHQINTGLPLRAIHYIDNSVIFRNNQTPVWTLLPGIFIQDEFKFNPKWLLLTGLRYDYHNHQGSIFTPRLALRYQVKKGHTTRITAGNGFRVVNIFTEDHAALTGARKVVISESLKPEKSWNVTLNHAFTKAGKRSYLYADFNVFYTWFNNRIIADYLQSPTEIIYANMRGQSISRGVSVNADLALNNSFKFNLGATLLEAFTTEHQVKKPLLFAPNFTVNFLASYTIPFVFITVDVSGKINSPMHLPVVPNDFRPETSPWYTILNLQLSRKTAGGIEWYGGAKNILNFVPESPILRPHDPFNKNINIDNPNGYTFDPSYNYAPVQGIKWYLGCRFTLKKSSN